MSVVVSVCLAGIKCRYDGNSSINSYILGLMEKEKCMLVCPESGLSCPRSPAEIVGGSGEDVLEGRARVISKDGSDVTREFIQGAYETLATVKENNIKVAYLKKRSPSCGYLEIYDGTFSGKLTQGNGVTAALLLKNGIEVVGI